MRTSRRMYVKIGIWKLSAETKVLGRGLSFVPKPKCIRKDRLLEPETQVSIQGCVYEEICISA
jgi:hypothetical protein